MCSPVSSGATAHESPRTSDQQFVFMLDAFRETGGLAPTTEILAQLRVRHRHARDVLAQWIEQRRVFCFEWQMRGWIPLFQFNRHNMAPNCQLQPVLVELDCAFDAWELGNWFATPNAWLAEQQPVAVLMTDFSAVVRAARADRFAANG